MVREALVGSVIQNHAAIYAQYVLGVRHRLSVGLGTPSIVSLYGVAPDLADALVIGISQSGASPDIIGVVAAARAQGAPTIAITNDPASPCSVKRGPSRRTSMLAASVATSPSS